MILAPAKCFRQEGRVLAFTYTSAMILLRILLRYSLLFGHNACNGK